jgi:hypothetical protein
MSLSANAAAATWNINPTTGDWYQLDVLDPGWVVFPLSLNPSTHLTACVVTLIGAAAHVSLPGTPPAVTLQTRDLAPGGSSTSWSTVATQADTSAGTTEYQQIHTISLTVNAAVTVTSEYRVKVTGEAGAGALVGLTLLGLRLGSSAP